MSINVTVTGNPVCIKRGKMVTADPNDIRKEFQKRRKIRLEQVRQQSKEIAESVRNKVKREKTKQLSNIEKQGAAKFSEWQNNKLLELQNQYRESLKDIGLGHTQAKIEEAQETEFIERRDKSNEVVAQKRGIVAQQQEQIIKNEENLKKAIPTQTRRMARDIENARSVIVSKMKRTPKKKRKKSQINVSITKDFSESDDELVELVDIAEESSTSDKSSKSIQSVSFSKSESSSRKSESPTSPPPKHSTTHVSLFSENGFVTKTKNVVEELISTTGSAPGSPKRIHNVSDVAVTETSFHYPLDTRISDRIKNRRIIDSHILSGVPPRINEICETSSDDMINGNESYQHFNRKQMGKPNRTNKEVIEVDVHKAPEGESQPFLGPCSTQLTVNNGERKKFTQVNTDFNAKLQNDVDRLRSKCRCLKENICTCRIIEENKKRSSKSSGSQTQTFITNKHNTVELPSKPTISLRSGTAQHSDKKEYNRVQYYDHDNRFSKDYIVDGSHVQKISDESIEVCANEHSETNFHQMEFHREKIAELRGKKALEKEKIQKDYQDLLQKLPVLQKQERIASLDPNRDKLHMSENRLKEFEKNRQHKIESAFERLIPNTITIQPKKQTVQQESVFQAVDVETCDSTGNLGTWKSVTNFLSHTNSKTSNENLKSLLEKLKSQKEILMQENEPLPANSNLSKLISDLEKSHRTKSKGSASSNSSAQKSQLNGRQKFKKSTVGTPKRKSNVHRDVLVLQNTSTQTSPKFEIPVPDKEKVDIVKNQDGKCLCPDNNDKICEIFIKIQDNDKPEIIITSPKDKKGINIDVQAKSIPDGRKSGDKDEKTCPVGTKRGVKTKPKKDNFSSWKEQLSKNDTNITTSSTSYYSPPNYSKDSQSGHLSNILHKKPQQSNMSSKPKDKQGRTLNTDLLAHIQKLLGMSKGSIEDLCVSSVSEVSTPSSSILETQNNIDHANNLINLLKHLNINVDNRAKKIDTQTKRLQTESDNSSTITNSQYSNGYNASQSHTFQSTPYSGNDSTNKKRSSNDARNISEPDYPENLFVKNITEITDKCQKKINKLTAKIESLRAEPIPIFSPTGSNTSDKENNTSYLNLPSGIIHEITSEGSNSPEQEELTKKLLHIDTSKFRDLTGGNNDLIQKITESVKSGQLCDEIDGDIIERYIQLLRTDCELLGKNESPKTSPKENNTNTFVPVLSDIPKLPKFTNGIQEKKPPPTKGFSNARKYNNINMIPHELSTIPEGDSVRRSKSPDSPSRDVDQKSNAESNLIQKLIKSSRYIDLENKSCTQDNSKKSLSPQNRGSPSKNGSGSIKSINSQSGSSSSKNYSGSNKSAKSQSGGSPRNKKNQNNIGVISNIQNKSKDSELCSSNNVDALLQKALQKYSDPKFKQTSPRHSPETKTYSISPKPGVDRVADLYTNPKPGTSKDISKTENKETSPVELIRIIRKLKDVSTDSSTDKSEDVETMLKNMGMGWAVATLKKTQEALARESTSSSSLDINSKITSSSSTDMSLKDTQSHSTSKSGSNNFFQDNFQDISSIHGSNGSAEKQQRTSTPVQTTKSSEKSKSPRKDKMFTGESDLSSVKERSKDNEWNFRTIPDYTANDSTID